MQNLLVTGKITPEMESQLQTEFSLQFIDKLDDPTSWFKENGEKFGLNIW